MNAAAAVEHLSGEDSGVISDAAVERACDFIDETGLVEYLTDRIDAQRRSRAGRPRTLTIMALLVGLLLTAVHDRTVLLARVNMLLHHRLSDVARQRLRVPYRPLDVDSVEASYAVVRRLFHSVVATFDDSPARKNRRLTEAEFTACLAPLTNAERHARKQRRVWVGNQLIKPSYAEMLETLRAYPASGSCVDATPIHTHARPGSRRRGIASADPDAERYLRTTDPETVNDAAARSGRKVRREVYGYEATLLVNGATQPADERLTPPVLVGGYTLEQPGHRPGGAAVDVLSDATANGWPTGLLAADRAYNNSQPADFQLPVRALGFTTLFDYKIDQAGIQAEHAGAIQVEGAWYCPHMPSPLTDATRDQRHGRIDDQTWRDRISARRNYALRPKAAPDAESHQRMHCPAAGAAPTARCPLKPASMRHSAKPTVQPKPNPAGPPAVCAQQSITVPPEAGAKQAQALPYGTPEWDAAYHTLRNGVEGANGYLKDPTNINLESSGTRRVRGIAAVHFLLGFQIAASNLRKQGRWRATYPQDSSTPPTRRRRRKTRPITAWAPPKAI